jgi:hypothetical protein
VARLDEDQEELLAMLCSAARQQDRGAKRSFLVTRHLGGQRLTHPSLPGGLLREFHVPDVELLAAHGLLRIASRGQHNFSFDVTPSGFEHWEQLTADRGAPVERLEAEVRRYLEGEAFRRRFGQAFDKWSQAEARLWATRGSTEITTIGHECREAIQAFANDFASAAGAEPNATPNKDVDNLRRGVAAIKERRPGAVIALLDALIVYWGTMSDLVQRQEHGAQKEGEPLGWEDARLVVFQTAIVMFECGRALDR